MKHHANLYLHHIIAVQNYIFLHHIAKFMLLYKTSHGCTIPEFGLENFLRGMMNLYDLVQCSIRYYSKTENYQDQ